MVKIWRNNSKYMLQKVCYVFNQLCIAPLKSMVEEFTMIISKELKVNSAHFIWVSSRRLERVDCCSRDTLSLGQKTEECSLKWISSLFSLGKSTHVWKCLKGFFVFMALDQDAGCPAFLKYLSLLCHFTKEIESKRTDMTSKVAEAELE